MPYSRITSTYNGKEAIYYVLNGKGHNGAEERNLLVTSVGLVFNDTFSVISQMNEFWKRASSKNLNQVRRIITSYSKKEFDPDDPLSAVIAAHNCKMNL